LDLLKLQGVGMTSKRTRDRLIARLVEQGIADQEVLEVMANTPRHLFVDEALAHRAYEDTALPISYGQTISQPYIVARMTELLLANATTTDRVLEIGTGSGYQTVVLAQLTARVYTVERILPLQEKARALLRQLGLRNVEFRHHDGALGWPEEGQQFDAILSAAAPRAVPQKLLAQLAPGGALVIPVGVDKQILTVYKRDADSGEVSSKSYEPVRFVPLIGGTTK